MEGILTAELLATWLKPREALTLVQAIHPDVSLASHWIRERLVGGLIVAGAASSSWNDADPVLTPCIIRRVCWSKGPTNDPQWWDTGDARFFFAATDHDRSRVGRYFGIRFKPDGFEEVRAEIAARSLRVSPAEYDQWRTPREALNELAPVPYNDATALIIDNARAGLLRAAARLIQAPEGFRREYQIISTEHWNEIAADDIRESAFWNTGTIKEAGPSTRFQRSHGFDYEVDEPVMTSLGVRFDPDRIAELKPKPQAIGTSNSREPPRPQPPDPVSPKGATPGLRKEAGPKAAKDDRPRLSDAEMKRFSEMIVTTYGASHAEAATYSAICALFPRNSVPRDHFLGIFREIRGRKSRGRPKASTK